MQPRSIKCFDRKRHARRTPLLLERVLGAHVVVGVTAALGRSLNHAVRVDPNVQPRRLLERRLQAVIRLENRIVTEIDSETTMHSCIAVFTRPS